MRGVAIAAGSAACGLVLASVAVADTIHVDGTSFTQDPKASISFKVKTNEQGKAKAVKGLAFEGLRVLDDRCSYLDTGTPCREGDYPPPEACGQVVVDYPDGGYDRFVSGALPGKVKLTKVPGEDFLSFSAQHFDPATNTTLSVEANVAKDGKKFGAIQLGYERWVESPGPETARPTRFHCYGSGFFKAKAARAPKSR